jgi:hypothetical protein
LQPTVTRVSEDQIFVPSPTPDLPSPTPTSPPTNTPVDTPIPTPSATEDAAAGAIVSGNGPQAISVSTAAETNAGQPGVAKTVPEVLPDGLVAIKVTAESDIYVQITADGVQYFAGNLSRGQSTDWIVGYTYSVYTTSGVNTMFTNNQGAQFHMGTEPGEMVYNL